MATTQGKRRSLRQRFLRKSLVIPAEHGSWSWLFVPFFVGAGVGFRNGAQQGSLLALLFLLAGGMSAFLLRQPATVWLRIRRGRGRRSDRGAAAAWTLGLGLLAFFSLTALLLLGRHPLLWLLLPAAGLLLLYLGKARIHRAGLRALWMELSGAGGLALMAPAGYSAVSGTIDATALLLGLLMALQNMLSVLYVRLRLAHRHGREGRRSAVLSAHLLGLLAVASAASGPHVPPAAVVPFVAFVARAAWAVNRRRPLDSIRRFGFTEVGVHVASGLWISAGYLAGR